MTFKKKTQDAVAETVESAPKVSVEERVAKLEETIKVIQEQIAHIRYHQRTGG